MYGLRFGKTQGIQEHINSMLELVNQLRCLGKELRDNNVVALLMYSLPESYGSLITLEARPETELTLEYVKDKLIDDNRRSENTVENNLLTESALQTKKNKNRNKTEVRSCHHCKKIGHLKKNV